MVAEQGASIERRRLPAGTVAYRQYHGTIPSIESVTSAVRSWVVTMGYKPQGPTAVEIAGTPSGDLGEEYAIEVQLPVGEHAKADPPTRSRSSPSSRRRRWC
jgi:effector-binding domain-containing protein